MSIPGPAQRSLTHLFLDEGPKETVGKYQLPTEEAVLESQIPCWGFRHLVALSVCIGGFIRDDAVGLAFLTATAPRLAMRRVVRQQHLPGPPTLDVAGKRAEDRQSRHAAFASGSQETLLQPWAR